MASDCVFCRIVVGDEDAINVHEWQAGAVMSFAPLNPVTPGHLLVIPTVHVDDALTRPPLTGLVMTVAAELAKSSRAPCNLITSCGPEATQTVPHLHIHIVPRREGDGLALPWTPKETS